MQTATTKGDNVPNVVQLRLVKREPNQEVISILLELLSEATQGSIVGLAATAECADGRYVYSGCGSLTDSPERGYYAASKLAVRFIK